MPASSGPKLKRLFTFLAFVWLLFSILLDFLLPFSFQPLLVVRATGRKVFSLERSSFVLCPRPPD
jgi:hypothetical protein